MATLPGKDGDASRSKRSPCLQEGRARRKPHRVRGLRGPGGRLSGADRRFGCAPRPAERSPSEQLDPVSLGARHPIPAAPRRRLLAPGHGGCGHSSRLDGGARRAVVRQCFQAGGAGQVAAAPVRSHAHLEHLVDSFPETVEVVVY